MWNLILFSWTPHWYTELKKDPHKALTTPLSLWGFVFVFIVICCHLVEEDLSLPPVEVSVVLNGKLLTAIKQVFRPMKWNWIVFLSAPGDISLPVDVITQQRYYSRHSSRRVSKQQLVLFDCKSKRCRRFSQIVLKLSLASFILQLLKKKHLILSLR